MTKQPLIFIAVSILATQIAAQTAIYTPETGQISIPQVKIQGDPIIYAIKMQTFMLFMVQ